MSNTITYTLFVDSSNGYKKLMQEIKINNKLYKTTQEEWGWFQQEGFDYLPEGEYRTIETAEMTDQELIANYPDYAARIGLTEPEFDLEVSEGKRGYSINIVQDFSTIKTITQKQVKKYEEKYGAEKKELAKILKTKIKVSSYGTVTITA